MFHWLTDRRRRHLLEQPFPAAWEPVLQHNVAILHRLQPAEGARLRELTQVFVAEKLWEGCGGFEITDETRVTIAAEACVLLLGRSHDLYAEVETILVYPSAVVAPPRQMGIFERGGSVIASTALIGQSFARGPVVLAWDAVLAGAREHQGSHNVTFHEFAHKIDQHEGPADGTPPLADSAHVRAWIHACEPAFLALREARERGESTFLDPYGATNEAEFFAVATEAYFMRPKALAHALPDLHAVLKDFYRVEPG